MAPSLNRSLSKRAAVYQVCIPHTQRDYFDYLSDESDLPFGSRVWVPFRETIRLGIIVGNKASKHPYDKLKNIDALIDEKPVLPKDILDLCCWVGRYYQSPLSEVLPLALPKRYRQGECCDIPYIDSYQLTMKTQNAHQLIRESAKKQHELIDYIAQHGSVFQKTMIKEGYSKLQLQALFKQQILSLSQTIDWPFPVKPALTDPLTLNTEQALATESIIGQLNSYVCFLLQGVTGSGKTEVYLQVIHEVLTQGKQVLFLVPEIGLTPQLLDRFRERIHLPMAIIHSHLNERERQIAWQLAKDKHVKLIIGTRTAVFTPMPELGLMIIDEEHDSSLKQMDRVRYSARDTALIRAHSADIPIILGSATPSLESLHNCTLGKYTLMRLTKKALTSTPLLYQLIDIRSLTLQQGLAKSTLDAIKEHLQKNNQVLVFINRRGFSPVFLCHQCGWMADCTSCDAHLTFHRQTNILICHHCGLRTKVPLHCLSCQSKELIAIGAGTQRIHEFLTDYFPAYRVLRIDRDEVRKKNAINAHLDLIHEGKAQLIVGTQMLAKGHHFPGLSLVVILDTDAGFYNQDFRATEQLGQLLIQVSGRAGRASQSGQVFIQTHLPQHPLLNCLIQKGYGEFAKQLLDSREKAKLPPYYYLAVIRAQSKNEKHALVFLHEVKIQLQKYISEVFGPAPAPLARKAEQHRMQLLIKSPSRSLLNKTLTGLRGWMMKNKNAQRVRWNIDVDPLDLS